MKSLKGIDKKQLKMGMKVELEHGRRSPDTDVTGDEPTKTAKIAIAHLRELPDYYTRLARMEKEGKKAMREDILEWARAFLGEGVSPTTAMVLGGFPSVIAIPRLCSPTLLREENTAVLRKVGIGRSIEPTRHRNPRACGRDVSEVLEWAHAFLSEVAPPVSPQRASIQAAGSAAALQRSSAVTSAPVNQNSAIYNRPAVQVSSPSTLSPRVSAAQNSARNR